jgi:hypothetical protein
MPLEIVILVAFTPPVLPPEIPVAKIFPEPTVEIVLLVRVIEIP